MNLGTLQRLEYASRLTSSGLKEAKCMPSIMDLDEQIMVIKELRVKIEQIRSLKAELRRAYDLSS